MCIVQAPQHLPPPSFSPFALRQKFAFQILLCDSWIQKRQGIWHNWLINKINCYSSQCWHIWFSLLELCHLTLNRRSLRLQNLADFGIKEVVVSCSLAASGRLNQSSPCSLYQSSHIPRRGTSASVLPRGVKTLTQPRRYVTPVRGCAAAVQLYRCTGLPRRPP